MKQSIGTVLIICLHKQSSQATWISKYWLSHEAFNYTVGKYVDQLINFLSKSTGGTVVVALQYIKVKEYSG
ncbi:uncharacterized protein G2W53_018047 [Senna tora]|uniref:Uncharacterized protein n=1 Tax=Senna tora TaxID=362788 RepID=A0A834TR95_9FABA|nr:uncharacterized protein G2W53_018047 [Senna tora]